MTSYFEHNQRIKSESLIRALQEGKNIALVSDAGTPGISDPGYVVIHEATLQGIPVVPIPGPSAAITALAAAGLPTDQFHFVGFLPPKEGKKRKLLESLHEVPGTLVIYESPFRVHKTVALLQEVLGDRDACAVHELTKIHEGFFRGPLSKIEAQIATVPAKGEWVILVCQFDEKSRILFY